jgi:hypothetical protein
MGATAGFWVPLAAGTESWLDESVGDEAVVRVAWAMTDSKAALAAPE